MTLTDAMTWARTANLGDYLITYADSGLTDQEDPGSRCGFSDDQLAAISAELLKRGMRLVTDDHGLLAATR